MRVCCLHITVRHVADTIAHRLFLWNLTKFTSYQKPSLLPEKNVNHIEDKDLLERFYNDHDNQWLGILLPRYTLLLFGVCMKYLKNEDDAKDAVQQIYFKVISELPKYKVEYFKSWIYMIAKNHCLMQLRNMVNKVALDEKMDLLDTASTEINHSDNIDFSTEQLNSAMQQLNEVQRETLKLFYLNKRSYREIAASMNLSLMQVKSFIHNGKRNLKQIITSFKHESNKQNK